MPKIKTTTLTQPVAPRVESSAIKLSAATGLNQILKPNDAGTAAMLPTEGTGFTWAFWFKSDKVANSFTRTLLTCRNSGGTVKMQIKYNTQLELSFIDDSGLSRNWISTNFSKTQEDDSYHHLAIVWSAIVTGKQ